jgi:hypothetical protein
MRAFYSNIILAAALLFYFNPALAQEEKKDATIELKYMNSNEQKSVQVRVFRKEKKEFIAISDKKIKLFYNSEGDQNLIGSLITDEDGNGNFKLEKKFQELTSASGTSKFTILGTLEENPEVQADPAELPVEDAVLKLSLYDEDSVHKMKATFFAVNEDKTLRPVPDVEIHFYAKREFGLLPVTESPVSTDSSGEAIADFPNTIKGDADGNLSVVIQVEENEAYGNLQTSNVVKWGVAVEIVHQNSRLLWSSRNNAPWSLVIIANGIILAVWGTIVYIVLQLFKIKKNNQPKTQTL